MTYSLVVNARPTSRIDGMFYELVAKYGWGMYGDSSALRTDPPETVELFVDQLLTIDGRDPELVTRRDRQLLRTIANDWVFDPSGRGAKSGLPLADSS